MDGVALAGIGVWRAHFRFRLSFHHNLARRDRDETVLVAVRTERGTPGYGQAIPRGYLTGESIDSVVTDIRERWWPRLQGRIMSAGTVGESLQELADCYLSADACRGTAAYAAVELAVLDAFARERHLPLRLPATATATDSGSLPLVGVLSGGGPRQAAWMTRVLRCLGYRHFKVKVGRDATADAGRLAAVRAAAGNGAWIAVDANAAWTREEAVSRMTDLAANGVSLVEEPLQREAAAASDFAALERKTGLAIMADESLCTQADAQSLLDRGSPSWWNLRLAKNGGCSGVHALAALAGRNGIRIYQGILVGECSLMAAAGRAALFASGAVCGEYGFPRFFLRGDPFRGGPGGFRGCMTPVPDHQRGLGVTTTSARILSCGQLVWHDGTYTGE
ncbi:MAG: hypothetical protein LIP77_03975 [Planctomycetes bacterium]|nr:hypothetical protein [Planctomycetota bacterium]